MTAPFAFALITWRESVVGMKPTERIQMDIRRTYDVQSARTGGNLGGVVGGGVVSETLGFVRWRIEDETLDKKPCRHLQSEAYDKGSGSMTREDVWTDAEGNLVRQSEVRASLQGKKTGEATFFPDHIALKQTDEKGVTRTSEMNPAGGMEAVQARFRPMAGDRKEFLRLDAVRGSFAKVAIVKTGRFKGTWGGDAYEGPTYRFTVDGREQTVMMTTQDELVRIDFNPTVALVLNSPTKSRRKPEFDKPVPASFP